MERRLEKIPEDDIATRVMIVALTISSACGGRYVSVEEVERRCEELQRKHDQGIVPLGELLGGEPLGEPSRPGSGCCRHRAILFKAVCERLDITPARLVRDSHDGHGHAWNIIELAG